MSVETARLSIIRYPDPVLRRPAEPLEAVDDDVLRVARRMLELMREAPGVGLAAPQVGLSWRMFVTNASGEPGGDSVFINPVLSEPADATEPHEEGCLSLPGIRGQITRPTAITITALDENGEPVSLRGEGLPARIWQHETDHLDGVLIIDRFTPMDKLANRRLLKDLEA